MKTVSHKAKLKFVAGQKVYYKTGKKVRSTTIKKVELTTILKKNKEPVTTVHYVALASGGYGYYYKTNRSFKEHQLFSSEEAAAKGMLPTEKSKIETMIKKVKKSITTSKQAIKRANDKLDEIKKEELIEQLSGI